MDDSYFNGPGYRKLIVCTRALKGKECGKLKEGACPCNHDPNFIKWIQNNREYFELCLAQEIDYLVRHGYTLDNAGWKGCAWVKDNTPSPCPFIIDFDA